MTVQGYTYLYKSPLNRIDDVDVFTIQSQLLGALRQSSENIPSTHLHYQMCKFLTLLKVGRVVDLSMKSLGIVIFTVKRNIFKIIKIKAHISVISL